MTNWERNAARCENEYGAYVNLKEGYYIYIISYFFSIVKKF